MSKIKFELSRKWFAQYPKTVFNSVYYSFFFGFSYSWFTAIDKIASIKAGEFPGQSRAIITERLHEAMPNIIVESVIKCLLIMIVLLIPILIYRFKLEHNIYLIHELKLYLKEKKTLKKDS